MSGKKAVFDADQGHGDHLDSILDGIEIQDFLKTVPELLKTAKSIGITENEISCNLEDSASKQMRFALIGNTDDPGRISMLIGCDVAAGRNALLSFYPEYDGVEVKIKLTAIHEWTNGVEATLEGLMLDDEREVAFFDTRYCLNKETYHIGGTYIFKISAFVYHKAEILQDPTFKFEGDAAVDYLRKIGGEVEYESDGSVKPVIFHMEEMVAFLQTSKEYPHLAELQSPIFGIEEKKLFNGNFYKFDIAIAQNSDEEKILIPLIAKKSLFAKVPEENEPLRGMVWLQGYCSAIAIDPEEENVEDDAVKVPIGNIKDLDYDLRKDDPGFSELNYLRKNVFDDVYEAWKSLDCSCFKDCLIPDFEYGSFWVKDPMFGADAYGEYINGKFETIRNSNSIPSVERVLLHSGKSPVDYNYALHMTQGENQTLLLFSFDGDKISKLYMTDPQLYKFVPCANPVIDENGEPVIFHSPGKFFKRGEMSEKDFQAFILDSYAKMLESQQIKVRKMIVYPKKNHPHMILETQGKTVYLFCDIFTPPFSDGQTNLNEMENFAEYARKQGAIPALTTLGMFCLDTNGKKAIYGGNFAMKASRILFL